MTRLVYLEEPKGRRRVETGTFPLSVGGGKADIVVPDVTSGAILAHFGISGEDLFVQPAAGRVVVNGATVSTSSWLRDGDSVRIGPIRLDVETKGETLWLRVSGAEEPKTDPPIVAPVPPSARPEHLTRGSGGATVKPIAFEPGTPSGPSGGRGRARASIFAFWGALALLGAIAWIVFSLRSVVVEVEPLPDHLEVQGSAIAMKLLDRFVLRPGSYRLVAEKEGFHRLETALEVGEERNQTHRFSMELLPGLLVLTTTPTDGALVTIDGGEVGPTPLAPIELDAGSYHVIVRADGYRSFESDIEVEGGGGTVELAVELASRWAPVTFRSDPQGARVRVAGGLYGPTPVTIDLVEGHHTYELVLDGYKASGGRIRVVAGEALRLPSTRLFLVDGRLTLSSIPGAAGVTVDGTYRGQTPLDVVLSPGEAHAVEVSRAGYVPKKLDVEVASGKTETTAVTLEAILGEIELAVDPPDAELFVNGEPRGPARQVLQLPAVAHRIEIRKDGYEGFSANVTPRSGFPQTIEVILRTAGEVKAAERKLAYQSSQGHELRLIEPLRIQMGASRREPGRRANETLREAELTRAFYLSTTEVTNRQFREFESRHRSGSAKNHSLEIDHHPAVRVTWEQAAAYCNWLSQKESLPPAYVMNAGKLVGAEPMQTGYRLPTEAEWARAARYPAGGSNKYPWGDALPVPAGSGNYADSSAEGLVPQTIPSYSDGFIATAPTDSFAPNALGILNLGGNVAEWVHDYYTIYPPGAEMARDPSGPSEGEFHVIRGSSWMHGKITELRVSYRDYGNKPRPDLGFRIARYLE